MIYILHARANQILDIVVTSAKWSLITVVYR